MESRYSGSNPIKLAKIKRRACLAVYDFRTPERTMSTARMEIEHEDIKSQ